MILDTETIKKDFPILDQQINGKTLIYLDNGATTQKPKAVIEAITEYYETTNSNVHRGIHSLSEKATKMYEDSRKAVQKLINAKSDREIIFTKGTTEAINTVAYSWGEANIQEGDEIIVTILEHHSNLVPWQQLCKRKGAKLKTVPLKSDLSLDMEAYKFMLSEKTKLVSFTAISNLTGTILPIKEMTKLAHELGAKVLLDAAQMTGHMPTNVADIDCDFMAFSAHKMLGPTGLGVLYGKEELLEEMSPFQFGGSMVVTVGEQNAVWNDLPWKFEAGTPNIAGVIAFHKALDYLQKIGLDNIREHDKELLAYAKEKFSKYKAVKTYSPENPEIASAALSFTIKGVHPHDIASIFNEENVAIRSGQHCAEPLSKVLGVSATARMSFYLYNDKEDIDRAMEALEKTLEIFKIEN